MAGTREDSAAGTLQLKAVWLRQASCYHEHGSSWYDLVDQIPVSNIPLCFPLQAEHIVEGDLLIERNTGILLCATK